jgi:hypothetical protein
MPYLAAIAAFLITVIGLNIAIGPRPSHCVDGWLSSSIGLRGACSHHGGVADDHWALPISVGGLLAGAGGLFGGFKWQSRNNPKSAVEFEPVVLCEPPPPSRLTSLVAT